ncbi:sigma 54-interacting transcriptional regulator [Hymenobacter sp. BT186]|uniref:Sigma 54-interacting transcriptional regulator n=1 Tax=Hymenobacter telluris TaxID=2816474 RepID=A0A939EWY8_9BACT|nr:sigma 54-interacting transcriptional regulator [Hymenobacter telluris]MBO0358938.1 sigma 54-interacting transcriptional regulator [Hymenobacter telluris]MBW3374964.1 sigma 54-interacting transcriptional regulator [Hymenobacter norwichensis]
MQHATIRTLGQLRASGYQPRSVKQELRDNLIAKLQSKEEVFPGIYGYNETVIPDLQRAILAGHHINLLGLRGQAKTRIARLLVGLLDEYIPVVEGAELNDDPLEPLSVYAKNLIAEHGDNTPVAWLHRDDRYTEKLATPDVSVADLIGDADPIKAATLKLPYSDERVIHFGLIPRAHRGIFVINELPDLQPRIQVSLFNILQEGDIQIRGFKVRLPLDLQFVFTANPEDYTNRGSIVTPLKDRIDAQIITHYPKSIEIGKNITKQEARIKEEQRGLVTTNEIIHDLVEQVAVEARASEFVDAKSGVSARLTISAFEQVVAGAERRALINGEKKTYVRVGDFISAVPAVTGKVELVYEGEQEGAGIVAEKLMGKAIRTLFLNYFPDPDKAKKLKGRPSPYKTVQEWFGSGNTVDVLHDASDNEYHAALDQVPGLRDIVKELHPNEDAETTYFLMEFLLHGLAEYSLISRNRLTAGAQFKDLLSSMFTMPSFGEDDDDEDEEDEKPQRGRRR